MDESGPAVRTNPLLPGQEGLHIELVPVGAMELDAHDAAAVALGSVPLPRIDLPRIERQGTLGLAPHYTYGKPVGKFAEAAPAGRGDSILTIALIGTGALVPLRSSSSPR